MSTKTLGDKYKEYDLHNEISDLRAKLEVAAQLLQSVIKGGMVGGSFEKKIIDFIARVRS